MNKKIKDPDSTLDLYRDYGGESLLLRQFWDAVDSGKNYQEAAFSTFSG